MRRWTIYGLSDPRTSEIRYVGVTFRWQRRFNEHLSRAKTGGKTHRDCWIRGLIQAGLRPTIVALETGTGLDTWQDAERKWIAFYRPRLVNHTEGGEGTPGYVPTAELREKWSKIRKGIPYAPGRVSGMKGRKHSAEIRARIAAAGTGRHHTAEGKARISAAHKGIPLSEEQKEKLRLAHKGKVLSDAHRMKIAAATKNRRPVLVIETGQVFASITEASKFLGVTEASVYHAIRKGCRCRGNHMKGA